MTREHTPGPWEVRVEREWTEQLPESHPVQFRLGAPHAAIFGSNHQPPVAEMADAHLLAAAPELLEALELWLEIEPSASNDGEFDNCDYCKFRDGTHLSRCPVGMARAAISKARGGE